MSAAFIGGVLVFLLVALMGGLTPRRIRRRPTRAQRIAAMQAERAELQRLDRVDLDLLTQAQHRALRMQRDILSFQWRAEFLRLQGQDTRADVLAAAVPQRERIIVECGRTVQTSAGLLTLRQRRAQTLDKRIRRARRWAWLDL